MLVNQISVFIENKPGRVGQLTDVLAKNNINLLNLSIADTKDYGVLRAVTDANEKAVKVLKESGFTVSMNDLIGVEVEDKPGALGSILNVFDKANLSIEYLYSFSRTSEGNAVILFRVENVELALKVLKQSGIKLISAV